MRFLHWCNRSFMIIGLSSKTVIRSIPPGQPNQVNLLRLVLECPLDLNPLKIYYLNLIWWDLKKAVVPWNPRKMYKLQAFIHEEWAKLQVAHWSSGVFLEI